LRCKRLEADERSARSLQHLPLDDLSSRLRVDKVEWAAERVSAERIRYDTNGIGR
jgi:hypothetical protein